MAVDFPKLIKRGREGKGGGEGGREREDTNFMLNKVRLYLQLLLKKPKIKKILFFFSSFLGTWFPKMERKFGGEFGSIDGSSK